MKNIPLVVTLIFLAGIFVTPASGQMSLGQYEDEAPLGSWNISAGLSFAYARDCTDISTNPALLNQMPAFTAVINGFFNNTAMNKFAMVNTGILSSRENPAFSVYGLDYGGFAVRFKHWGIALSTGIPEIYDRPAIVSEYESGGTLQRRISFGQKGYLRNTNLSLAYTPGNRVTAGIGFNFISGGLDRSYKDYFAYYDDLEISDTRSQSYSGFFITGGVTAKISSAVTLAAVLRAPYGKKAEGESCSRYFIPELETDIQIRSAENSLYRQPLMAGAGIKLLITHAFTATADIAFFNWNHYEVNYFGLDQIRNFKNTLKTGFSVEYMGALRLLGMDWQIPIWSGFHFDPQPMRDPSSFYTSLLFGTGIRSGSIFLHLRTQIGSEHGSGDSLQTRSAALTIGYELK